MTSSFTLQKINQQKQLWTYANKGATLGGLEDRHIRISGNCHPDFVSVPIGSKYGAQLCVRKTDQCGKEIGTTLIQNAEQLINESQGYHRGVMNLYDVKPQFPTQQVNPQYLADRRTPWDADLVRRDYSHHPLKYSGTGITTLRTPHQLEDAAKPYWEYDYTYSPIEDPSTGMRTATKLNQTVPPAKWDVTKLHQDYPVFLRESEYIGNPQNKLDTKYFTRIV
jgi:hypothetical protein